MLGGVAWVGACEPAATPAPEGRLRIAWSADPATLDPAQVVDVVGGSAVSLVYEGLLALDRSGEVAPGIARLWGPLADGPGYRFEINPAARSSDGRAIVAADVIRSFERLLDPRTASPRSWVLERVLGAREFRVGRAERVDGLI